MINEDRRLRDSTALSAKLGRVFPEKRITLRSDSGTRYLKIGPGVQCAAFLGSATIAGWAVLASSILAMQAVTGSQAADAGQRETAIFEARLDTLSGERDAALAKAEATEARFAEALREVALMQDRLIEAETRQAELEGGLGAVRERLAVATKAADEAEARLETVVADAATGEVQTDPEIAETLAFLTDALASTAEERDRMQTVVTEAAAEIEAAEFEQQLAAERRDRLFQQIEEAVAASLGPLDEMFDETGLPTDSILAQVRRAYSGTGGPEGGTITTSSRGMPADADTLRATEILARLDELNTYRMAAAQTPFAIPVRGSYRFTSGFGRRWGRMHKGADFAGAKGTPIHTTADGTVVFAGKKSGYGNVVYVRHDFGIETRYAHMSKIHVSQGQRVSRGDRIGDMGNTGRSTGTHLHYEVRIDGEAVNPMTYIEAARDVF